MDDEATPDETTASKDGRAIDSVDDRWLELADLISLLIARRVLRLQRERRTTTEGESGSTTDALVATDGSLARSELTVDDMP
jgi:hypothetical protein